MKRVVKKTIKRKEKLMSKSKWIKMWGGWGGGWGATKNLSRVLKSDRRKKHSAVMMSMLTW
jgi:hypothetical protein